MSQIEDLAKKHLGSKQGDYSQCNYSEPDASLLVGIPRELNRTGLHQESLTMMEGFDIWRGYEVSVLNDNGYPMNFIATLIIKASSPNIVESKSMKLFWNSFNFYRAGKTYIDVRDNVESIATAALNKALNPARPESLVQVSLIDANNTKHFTDTSIFDDYTSLDKMIMDYGAHFSKIDSYRDEPSLLTPTEKVDNQNFHWSGLRSNCRVTKQPDFGDIWISMGRSYDSETRLPSDVSMVKYLTSLRGENHFHEEIVEQVYTTLNSRFKGAVIGVFAFYTRRGGWDICPVRHNRILILPPSQILAKIKTPRQ